MKRHSSAGFTLVETGAVICVGGAAAVFATVGLQPGSEKPERIGASPETDNGREESPEQCAARIQLKDAVQLRGLAQSLIIWSMTNDDRFPLPSDLDSKDRTVSLNGRAKDTTANIFSLLLYNGMVSPELLVSPAEVSPNIKVDDNYQYSDPKAAMDPAQALWDPAFKADFTNGQTGNVSYAHMQPSESRMKLWRSNFVALEPIISNRAPQIVGVERTGDDEAETTYNLLELAKDSLTFKIHGAPESWEGNVAFGDGHVELMTRLAPAGSVKDAKWLSYTTHEEKKALDCFFVDEPDAKQGSNAYMGIFTTAGKSAKDYRGIWD